MPRNGTGTFARADGTYSGEEIWTNNRDATINIIASAHDTHDQDIADAITASVARDGQTTPTANLPMGGYRHTNVGLASARSDYARASQVQDCAFNYGTCVSAANVYTVTMTPAVTAYVTGMEISFKADATASGAITLKLNSLTAKKLYRAGGVTQATTGDLRQDKYFRIAYDSALDSATGGFVLLGEGRSIVSYTPSVSAAAPMGFSGTITYAHYQTNGDMVTVQIRISSGTTTGSPSAAFELGLPFTAAALGSQTVGPATINDGGTVVGGNVTIDSGGSVARVFRFDRTNFGVGAGREVECSFTYLRA
jgi:hypothetical protein